MTKNFNKLRYMIVLVSEVDKVDFAQVFETSTDTIRISINGKYTFFKYVGETPSSIEALSYKDGAYTHEEIMVILNSPEWINEPN